MSVIARDFQHDGLLVFAVNAWDEPLRDIKRFVRQRRLKQYILLNGSQVLAQYGVTVVPTVLFIDRNGVIVDAEVGFDGPEPLRRKAKALLGQS